MILCLSCQDSFSNQRHRHTVSHVTRTACCSIKPTTSSHCTDSDTTLWHLLALSHAIQQLTDMKPTGVLRMRETVAKSHFRLATAI